MNREFYTRTLLTEDGRVIRLREPALVRIADPNERRGRLRMKDGRVIEISGEQLLFLLSNPFEEIGRFEIRWRLKKNRGPQRTWRLAPCCHMLPFWAVRRGVARHANWRETREHRGFSMRP